MNAEANPMNVARPLAVALLAAAAVGGCGGGGDGGGSGQPAPSSLALTLQPTAVLLGQSAQLSWSASSGAACQASGGWSGAQNASGNLAVTSAATGSVTFTLLCSGGGYTGDVTESVTLTVTAASLSQLQANVFTPRCTICHDGSQPAGGLLPGSMNLSAGNSFANLVGVASQQQSNVLRVAPGNPAASYLVRKVEGAPGITGERMPLGAAPLDAATIAQIRSWIAAGAANN